MKRFIETIQNIFNIEELRNKILYTLLFLIIFRLGTHVVLPGIDPTVLSDTFGQSGVSGILDIFSGGAFSNASVFALGVMPYITASIIVQLLGIAVPAFQKMQKEGESGRNKLNYITRFITIGVCFVQGFFYLSNLKAQQVSPFFEDPDFFFFVLLSIIMMSGTMFVMWLGEKITEKGIGNGVSLIIMANILARLPQSFVQEFTSRANSGGEVIFVAEIILLFMIIIATIALVQATRRIPINFAKKIIGSKDDFGGQRQFLPLKVNASGVMPIIFAQAILVIPATLFGYFDDASNPSPIMQALTKVDGLWYNVITILMIVIFTYFYTAIYFSPSQMADDIKKSGGFIPNVKPGEETASFIDSIMTKITLPGSIFLALIAILPAITMALVGTQQGFAYFFGGTSLLIAVGVALDTLQQIETYLLNKKYDGLMKSGKVKGRTATTDIILEKE
jgi:preprotein translocase subunit SecY